jgi:hypothetical protein
LKAAGPAPLGIQNGQEPNRRTHGTSGSPPAHVRRPMAPGSLRAHQQHPSHCPSLPSCTSHNPRAGLPYLEHPLTREKARSGSAAAAQRQRSGSSCAPSASTIASPSLLTVSRP